MSESNEGLPVPVVPDSAADGAAHARERRALRRKTAQFIVVFLASVLVLLAGYETVKSTVGNGWYLLQVAGSTKWLLSHTGYSCQLGDPDRYQGKEDGIRKALAAAASGEAVPAQALVESSPGARLSPWEAYKFQVLQHRSQIAQMKKELARLASDTNTPESARAEAVANLKKQLAATKARETGPLVCFVLKPGLDRQLSEKQTALTAAQKEGVPDEAVVAALKGEVAKLKEQVAERNKNRKPGDPPDELFFNFIVIPDCGAIPSIAIFVAAVLAFPASWWRKALGLLVGVPILYWVNAFRLMFLAMLGAWDRGGSIFTFAHEYLWQGVYIIFVVAVWIGWVELLVRRRTA